MLEELFATEGMTVSTSSNGKRPILLAEGVPSISNPGTTGNLYVEIAGKKVTFSVVQGRPGERTTQGHTRDPRNDFLVLKDNALYNFLWVQPPVKGTSERLGQVGVAAGGSVYAKLKAKPSELDEDHIKDFTSLLRETFGKELPHVKLRQKDTELLLKVLENNLGINPADLALRGAQAGAQR